jgi:hypothetical protein
MRPIRTKGKDVSVLKIATSSPRNAHVATGAVALVVLALGCDDGGSWQVGNGAEGSSSGRTSGSNGGTSSGSGSGGANASTSGSTGSSSGSTGSSGQAGSSGTPGASGSGASTDSGPVDDGAPADASTGSPDASSCAAGADPLRTGDMQKDGYDCMLLALAQMYGDPDPMMAKAQIQVESGFNVLATSPDSPCGDPNGWTDAESKSFGLIQVTPACGEENGALLSNGHPNLDMDMSSPLWGTSVYNPTLNLDAGMQSITGSLKDLQMKYPGCTTAQYVEMSAGAFNSGEGAVSGCALFDSRAQGYVDAVLGNYRQFAQAAGWPDPY